MSALKQPPNTPQEYLIVPLYPSEEFQDLYFKIHQKVQLLDHNGVMQYFYTLLSDAERNNFDLDLLKITNKLIDACLKDQNK